MGISPNVGLSICEVSRIIDGLPATRALRRRVSGADKCFLFLLPVGRLSYYLRIGHRVPWDASSQVSIFGDEAVRRVVQLGEVCRFLREGTASLLSFLSRRQSSRRHERRWARRIE